MFPENLNVSRDEVKGNIEIRGKQNSLLYSWHFSSYSMPIYWLVRGHMTSNNETVSRLMPRAGNIAKTMTSNGKQFTVTREMLTAVARDDWNLSTVFKFCFCFVLLHNKCRISMFPSTSSRETLRFSGNKIHCSPRDQSLSEIKLCLLDGF